MIKPTEQQANVIQAFKTVTEQKPLVVKARAGTGKTWTIEQGSRDNPDARILLLCFNKPIAEAAKLRMPANVTCKTFAAFSWNAPMADGFLDSTYGRVYGSVRNERGVQRVNWYFQAKMYAKKFKVELPIINAARATIDYFVSTADAFIGKFHVPYLLWAGKPKEEQEGFKEEVVTIARKMWRMKENPKDRMMPVNWNDITKLVQLEGDAKRFRGQFDYVIVDEAQDITACVLDLIKQMRCPIILVGDDFQRLYAFIHTINSLDELGGEPLFLTESHRFDQTIANAANDVLDLLQHKTPKLVGTGQPAKISYSPPTARYTMLSRTNTGLLANALQAIRQDKRIHVMGDLMGAMKQLESGYYLSIGQPDKVTHHSLSGFSTWDEIEALSEIDSDMKLLCSQIKMYGNQIPHLCSELEDAGEVPECKADVVLSTIHKAKGREWPHVKLDNDFSKLVYFSKKDREYKVKKFEVYTMYVGVTRAQQVLYPNDIFQQCKGWKELLA